MPKEAVNLPNLIEQLEKGLIEDHKPLLNYVDQNQKVFPVFQNSGLSVIRGHEGSGKTKFLTQVIIDLILQIKRGELNNYKLVYCDTERPKSQYASTVSHILKKTNLDVIKLS